MYKKSLNALGLMACLLGVSTLGSGCDSAEGIKVAIEANAAAAVTDAVDGIVTSAVGNIVGSVVPVSNGE